MLSFKEVHLHSGTVFIMELCCQYNSVVLNKHRNPHEALTASGEPFISKQFEKNRNVTAAVSSASPRAVLVKSLFLTPTDC